MHFLSDLRTVAGPLRHSLRSLRGRAAVPVARAWGTALDDPDVGPVRLSGVLREPPPAVDGAARDELVVLVHGLAGSPASYYCAAGARALAGAGVASLAVALRGADRRGEDFYNIALTADLHAVLASPEVAAYERVYVVGYSMGGYVALHYACEAAPRVRGVAALCTPIDLASAQRCIDRRRAWLYRTNVLRGLVEIYGAVAARRPVPSDPREVRRVRTMYDWDRLTIAPRYGFDGPEHYYRELSVERRLGALRVPALLVAAARDPVVPEETIRPFLPAGAAVRPATAPSAGAGPGLEVRWVERAGHLSFPRGALGDRTAAGIEVELLRWLRASGAPADAGAAEGAPAR